MKTFKYKFSIAFADTDAGGIVYHGRYIEIAERARMEMMRGIKIPADDNGFVVHEISIKYLRPLHLADDIVVESEIINIGAASMEIQQKFVHNDTICAIMDITVVYIGADMHAKCIPESITSHLDYVKEGKNE